MKKRLSSAVTTSLTTAADPPIGGRGLAEVTPRRASAEPGGAKAAGSPAPPVPASPSASPSASLPLEFQTDTPDLTFSGQGSATPRWLDPPPSRMWRAIGQHSLAASRSFSSLSWTLMGGDDEGFFLPRGPPP